MDKKGSIKRHSEQEGTKPEKKARKHAESDDEEFDAMDSESVMIVFNVSLKFSHCAG